MPWRWLVTGAWVAIMAAGCASTDGRDSALTGDWGPHTREIELLYKQAHRTPVHPFRKPVRDQRERAAQNLQQLQTEYLAALGVAAPPAVSNGTQPGGKAPSPPPKNAEKAPPQAAPVRQMPWWFK